ncbi:hypothetical protein RhiJN_26137 [Ceratobasidium sp. AG-Ba]|nr:hypothetical protein RhiJN_26137 [Ceratobasidium sp. AG-Ba]
MPAKSSCKSSNKTAPRSNKSTKSTPKGQAKEEVVAAAEAVYAILKDKDIPACAIGSTAMACDPTRQCIRDPGTIDFLTFAHPNNQRSLNDLLANARPDIFTILPQKQPNSHLPPVLVYQPVDSTIKRRVCFIPIWTNHSKENMPELTFEDTEPIGSGTVPVPPLPYQLWLQLHGWVWNTDLLRKNLNNKRAQTKQSNFALDISSLLPLVVKKKGHFDWLPDKLRQSLANDVSEFASVHPTSARGWQALGIEFRMKRQETSLVNRKEKQEELSSQKDSKRPAMGFMEGKKGSQAERLLKEQVDDMYY